MPTRDDFEVALANHLVNSYTTFLELPEAKIYIGKEGQHAWKQTNIWFHGRNETAIIQVYFLLLLLLIIVVTFSLKE